MSITATDRFDSVEDLKQLLANINFDVKTEPLPRSELSDIKDVLRKAQIIASFKDLQIFYIEIETNKISIDKYKTELKKTIEKITNKFPYAVIFILNTSLLEWFVATKDDSTLESGLLQSESARANFRYNFETEIQELNQDLSEIEIFKIFDKKLNDWSSDKQLYENKSLFSKNFLERRIKEIPADKDNIEQAYIKIKQIYEKVKSRLITYDESQTEQNFIQPVLNSLGFEFTVQPKFKRQDRIYKPDYALFTNRQIKDEAESTIATRQEFYETPFLKRVASLLEAKYWQRSLDISKARDDRDSQQSQGKVPQWQIMNYLDRSAVKWGILTNGSIWRLYYGGVQTQETLYYSVDLQNILERNDIQSFEYFYRFFSKDAFERDASGKTFLGRAYEESKLYAKGVEERLRTRIFEKVVPIIAKGFVKNRKDRNVPTKDDDLPRMYNAILILLYRLIFVLYAEARNLVPVSDEFGYGEKSLTKIKTQIVEAIEEGRIFSEFATDYWGRLKTLFRIIDFGDSSLKIPRYDGGLFALDGLGDEFLCDAAKFLEKNDIPDEYLKEAICLLSMDLKPDESIQGKRFIDYSDLDVRHIGSVYEGLLEFSLKIVDKNYVKSEKKYVEAKPGQKPDVLKGNILLTNDKLKRKISGSYFTPDYIVSYIVENTVCPLIENIRQEKKWFDQLNNSEKTFDELFDEITKAKHKDDEETKKLWELTKGNQEKREFILNLLDGAQPSHNYDPPTRILELKILDPAMGSGHFLIGAMDFLARSLAGNLLEYDESPVFYETEENRNKIINEAKNQGIEVDEKKLTEENIIRRMVMKRCLYGVDLNPMAVELAKLSMWLHAFTVGAPLSFLDHHFKCGNSLVGAKLDVLLQKSRESGQLMAIDTEPLKRAMNCLLMVAELPDATYDEVKKSRNEYTEANNKVEAYRALLNCLVVKYFGVETADQAITHSGFQIDINNFWQSVESLSNKQDIEIIKKANEVANKTRFFHWEIEFPEIFFERNQSGINRDITEIVHKTNSGFDVVIGNPPWGADLAKEEKEYFKTLGTDTSTPNSYIYMVKKSELLTKSEGRIGVIVPDSILVKDYSITRYNLLTNNTLNYIIYLEQVFKEVNHDCSIIILQRGKQSRYDTYGGIVPKDEILIGKYLSLLESGFFNDSELEYRFNLNLSSANLKLYKKLTLLQKIGNLGNFHEGIHTGNIREKLFFKSKPSYYDFEKVKPCLIGGKHGDEFGRYYYISNNNWVIYDPALINKKNKEYASLRDENIFIGSKLYVTRTGEDFYCFYDERHYASNNLFSYKFKTNDSKFSYFFIMALLNSRFAQKYNRLYLAPRFGRLFTETKIVHLKLLPIPLVSFTTPKEERKQAVEMLKEEFASHKDNSLKEIDKLFPGKTEIVHDFLVFLAEQMIEMNKQQQELAQRFWTDLKGITSESIFKKLQSGKQEKTLAKKPSIQPFVESDSSSKRLLIDSLCWNKNAFEDFALLAGRIPNLANIVDVYEKYSTDYRTLSHKLNLTDELIDEIVYKLYGLDEKEIELVKGSTK